jgi:predicted nucleotide-binding protein (sugar kinase/HSP70/actin superfamily)
MTEQGRTSKLHPLKKLKLQRDIYTAKTRLWYQERSERNIETPFLPITGIFPDPTLSEVMSEGAKYLDPAFGGEAIISAAELSLAMHHGYSSALNLMPFTCMPSNVVIGLEQSIRGANKHFPIAHLEYDGSEDPTYRDRLAVHAHQSHRHFDRNADQILTTQEHHRKQALAAYHKKADPSRKIK